MDHIQLFSYWTNETSDAAFATSHLDVEVIFLNHVFSVAHRYIVFSPGCRDSCHFRPDGDYPCDCRGCPHYFRCTRGRLQYRLCPRFRCWNPFTKMCNRGKFLLKRTETTCTSPKRYILFCNVT